MKIISGTRDWMDFRQTLSGSIGFVPTMGALHAGHGDLVKRSVFENDKTVVSLFVNPTQFNDPEDFKKYPRTLDADARFLQELGVDFIFAPSHEAMYPDNYQYHVLETTLSQKFCGPFRPGHFEGMLTVVLKLLNLVRPHKAYFGEKDYQQLKLIEGMVSAFFLDIEICPCPTIRESSGLALSSRNKRLSESGRQKAAEFPQILMTAKSASEAQQRLNENGFKVDYVEDWQNRRLAAVHLEGVRLIDNVITSGNKGV